MDMHVIFDLGTLVAVCAHFAWSIFHAGKIVERIDWILKDNQKCADERKDLTRRFSKLELSVAKGPNRTNPEAT